MTIWWGMIWVTSMLIMTLLGITLIVGYLILHWERFWNEMWEFFTRKK